MTRTELIRVVRRELTWIRRPAGRGCELTGKCIDKHHGEARAAAAVDIMLSAGRYSRLRVGCLQILEHHDDLAKDCDSELAATYHSMRGPNLPGLFKSPDLRVPSPDSK